MTEQKEERAPEIRWATLMIYGRKRNREIIRPIHQGENGEYVRYHGQRYYLRKMRRENTDNGTVYVPQLYDKQKGKKIWRNMTL